MDVIRCGCRQVGFKQAIRKSFLSLKGMVNWLLPSEGEAMKLPSENRRKGLDSRLSDLGPDLDSFLSGISPFPVTWGSQTSRQCSSHLGRE